MIYLFIVFILGFIISNIPAYPMLYPPVLVQMMFIFPIVYLSLIRFLRNRPSNCFTYLEVTFSIDILSGIFLFYTLTNFILSIRNSFLLTGAKYISNELTQLVCRAPVIVYMCSVQTGKRSLVIVFVVIAAYLYANFFFSDWVNDMILRDNLVTCTNQVCQLNRGTFRKRYCH